MHRVTEGSCSKLEVWRFPLLRRHWVFWRGGREGHFVMEVVKSLGAENKDLIFLILFYSVYV